MTPGTRRREGAHLTLATRRPHPQRLRYPAPIPVCRWAGYSRPNGKQAARALIDAVAWAVRRELG
jgi:hypothetical protein